MTWRKMMDKEKVDLIDHNLWDIEVALWLREVIEPFTDASGEKLPLVFMHTREALIEHYGKLNEMRKLEVPEKSNWAKRIDRIRGFFI
jgi:hypothetical protein